MGEINVWNYKISCIKMKIHCSSLYFLKKNKIVYWWLLFLILRNKSCGNQHQLLSLVFLIKEHSSAPMLNFKVILNHPELPNLVNWRDVANHHIGNIIRIKIVHMSVKNSSINGDRNFHLIWFYYVAMVISALSIEYYVK